MRKKSIAISGLGLITCLGDSKEENWERLAKGETSIRPIERFDTKGLKTNFAGCVENFGPISGNALSDKMALDVATQAFDDSALDERTPIDRIFLALPGGEFALSSRVHLEQEFRERGLDAGSLEDVYEFGRQKASSIYRERYSNCAGKRICEMYNIKQSPILVSTACASGASAIQLASDAIERGEIERALVVGSDSGVSPEGVMRFSLLSALSTRNEDPSTASRPFSSTRDGFVMGEGAGALVLESREAAVHRNVEPYAFIRGCGDATDNFHRTRSNPTGEVMTRCMNNALIDAGIGPDDLDVVNAHGTSTPENDKMECLGLQNLFGREEIDCRVTSNKSMIGHTLSAAGAVEAVISALMIRHEAVTPSINVGDDCDFPNVNIVTSPTDHVRVNYVLSNSFGFGGQNVSLVLGKHVA